MKITENQKTQPTKSKLDTFSEKKFTLELDGFELLALAKISSRVGGIGKFRSVFSDCGYNNNLGISHTLRSIDGLKEALKELESHIDIDRDSSSIHVHDNL